MVGGGRGRGRERDTKQNTIKKCLQQLYLVISPLKDTTDVQNSVFLVDYQSQLLEIDCVFLVGTKAQGCHVVLNGSFGERVVQVPRDGATLRGVLQVNIDKPLEELNYFVFDWEEDGSIGTVPVPVDVMIISSSTSSTLGTYVLYTIVQLPTIITHSL